MIFAEVQGEERWGLSMVCWERRKKRQTKS